MGELCFEDVRSCDHMFVDCDMPRVRNKSSKSNRRSSLIEELDLEVNNGK